jgi:hypothetical protein
MRCAATVRERVRYVEFGLSFVSLSLKGVYVLQACKPLQNLCFDSQLWEELFWATFYHPLPVSHCRSSVFLGSGTLKAKAAEVGWFELYRYVISARASPVVRAVALRLRAASFCLQVCVCTVSTHLTHCVSCASRSRWRTNRRWRRGIKQQLHVLEYHPAYVHAIRLVPEAGLVLSAGADEEVVIW